MLEKKILAAWFFFQIFLYFLVKHRESLLLHQMSLRLDFTPTFKFYMVGVTSKSYLLLSTCLTYEGIILIMDFSIALYAVLIWLLNEYLIHYFFLFFHNANHFSYTFNSHIKFVILLTVNHIILTIVLVQRI